MCPINIVRIGHWKVAAAGTGTTPELKNSGLRHYATAIEATVGRVCPTDRRVIVECWEKGPTAAQRSSFSPLRNHCHAIRAPLATLRPSAARWLRPGGRDSCAAGSPVLARRIGLLGESPAGAPRVVTCSHSAALQATNGPLWRLQPCFRSEAKYYQACGPHQASSPDTRSKTGHAGGNDYRCGTHRGRNVVVAGASHLRSSRKA